MRNRRFLLTLAIPTVTLALAEGCSSSNTAGFGAHTTSSKSSSSSGTAGSGLGGGIGSSSGLGGNFGSSSGTTTGSGGMGGGGTGGASSSSSGASSASSASSAASSSGSAGCGFTTGDPVCDGCLTTSCCTEETACANDTTCTTCVTSANPPASCNSNNPYIAFGNCFVNNCNTQCGGGSSSSSSSASSTSSSSSSSSSTSSGSASSSSSASSATSASSTSSSSASSTSSSGSVACTIGHLVISQVRSRGAGGAGDEFIELWNPTAAPVTLDNTWKVRDRSTTATVYTTRWTGTGAVIPAFGHYLITGGAYTETPAGDASIVQGITDASNLVLVHGTANVDVLCYAFDAASQAILTDPTKGYTCAGTPADNSPHNNGTSGASNSDVSIVRKPGGSGNNCTDTNVSAADFVKEMPAQPHSTASAPTP